MHCNNLHGNICRRATDPRCNHKHRLAGVYKESPLSAWFESEYGHYGDLFRRWKGWSERKTVAKMMGSNRKREDIKTSSKRRTFTLTDRCIEVEKLTVTDHYC